MALRSKSLFLYNLSVTASNQNIPFKAASGGSELTAVIPTGYYSLSTLLTAIASAMIAADPTNTYTATADRTISSGTENRVTIATNGIFLSLLFSSGATAPSSIRDLIGFAHADQTGATTYTSSSTSGTALVTAWYATNYTAPEMNLQNVGTVNVSTSGLKEGIFWSLQQFIIAEYMYESQADVFAFWNPLLIWMIQQKPFDFTPEVSSPSTVYPVTLEKSAVDGKGLAFMMKEQVPDFPFRYTTGSFTMRVVGS